MMGKQRRFKRLGGSMQAGSFKGRTAVVTGGARGIGFACAAKIAAGGSRIALWDRDMDRARQSAASLGDAIAVEVDVTSEQSLADALAGTEKQLAAPDILVASAGITGPNTTVIQYPVEAWKQVIDINLTGVFLSNRAVAPGMAQRGWGRIVNIASDTVSLTVPEFVHYVTSKAGVIGFTRAIATEFGAQGVTANVIAPGLTRTPGTLARDEWGGVAPEIFFKAAAEHIPMRRLGAPDDLVGAMSFLTSDDAAYITGQTIYVNGGLTRT
jgi:NAD(P)-dependent dehydrogenase (short-subunit alcohol dehydrogenase family)